MVSFSQPHLDYGIWIIILRGLRCGSLLIVKIICCFHLKVSLLYYYTSVMPAENSMEIDRDGPKAPTAVPGPLGITCHPNEKANVIADYLENQFTSHDLCDENHERQVETIVQALLNRRFGGTLVQTRSTRHHIPKNGILHSHCCENLKSCK
jgi:hypothetical protein